MKKNMGQTDRAIRLAVAALLAILFYSGILNDTLGIVALVISFNLTLTSFMSFCPLYSLFKINTFQINLNNEKDLN